MEMGYLIGGMLGRVVSPIAQDIFENKTQLGREFAEKKFEKQRRLSTMEYENKLALSRHDHEEKLAEMEAQFDIFSVESQKQYSGWHFLFFLFSYDKISVFINLYM